MNKRRYSDIAKVMKELGGCRAWDFSDLHISKRMVELGLEEYDPEEPSKRVRRARKQTSRRSAANGNGGVGTGHDNRCTAMVFTGGKGLHSAENGHECEGN